MSRRITAPALPRVAALYPRVSDPAQDRDERTSLKTQEAGERAWALANGYAVEEQYIYRERHSAEEYYERPELTRLRADAKARKFAIVVVHSVERLARDPIHQGIIIEELDRTGVKVHFVTEPIDNDSPDGQLVRFVRAYAGKIENERKKERVMRAMRERARLGKFIPGCRPPYGYQWGPERDEQGRLTKVRLVINPETSRIVMLIFEECAAGTSLKAIARKLTEQSILSPTGKVRWAGDTIRYMLNDSRYWGQAEALRTKEIAVEKHLRSRYAEKMRTIPRDPSERIPLPHSTVPPIISPDLAAAVVARLHLNQQQATRNNQHPERALLRGGIARCGYCGYALYPNNHQSPYGVLGTAYRCSHRHRTHPDCQAHAIEAHLLDNAVWAKVSTVLKNRSLIEQEIEHMRATEAPGTDVLASIDKIIADLSAQIARKRHLFELTDDEETQNELADEINQLAALRRGHEAERVNAELHYADWQQQRDGLQQTLDWCERLGEHVDTFTYEQRRTTLLALKVAVQLWRADHKPRARLTIRLPLSDIITLELDTLELGALAYCDEDGSSSSYHVSSLFQ